MTTRTLGQGLTVPAIGLGWMGMSTAYGALAADDRRRDHPRFRPENIASNLPPLGALGDVAAAHGAMRAQVAIAWVMARGEGIVPIPGAKKRRWLEENRRAADLALSAAEMAALDEAFPPGAAAGTRYPQKQMAGLGI